MSVRARSLLCLPFLVVCHLPSALAQGRTETSFPLEPLNAWAVALGGAGAAKQGAAFSSLNPAALAGERGAELSHRASPIGTRDYAIAAGHAGRWGTLRITARRRDWGEIAHDLGVDGLTAGEQSVALTFADRVLRGRVAWGVSLARLDADYLGSRSGTWAADLGAQGYLGRGFGLGVALLHAGKGFENDGGRAPLPTRLRPGVAWEGRLGTLHLAMAGDLPLPVALDAPPDAHAGAEIGSSWGSVTAAVRTGYRSLVNRDGSGSRLGAWTLGGGIRVGRLAADIAYTFGVVFGDERFVSLSLHW